MFSVSIEAEVISPPKKINNILTATVDATIDKSGEISHLPILGLTEATRQSRDMLNAAFIISVK